MQTLYKTQEKKYIQIPDEIQTQVNERGFYLYNWIGANDVKASIERDFLKILGYVGFPFAVIAILSFVLTMNPFVFLWVTFAFSILFMVYLSFLWFFRGIKLSKNGYVVVTDTALSVNGKIVKLDEMQNFSQELSSIENEFEETLFKPSNLQISKSNFLKNLKQKISDGYANIFRFSNSFWGQKWGNLLFLALAAYTIFIIVMAGVYVLWSFLIMIFGVFINIISRYILMKSGDEVVHIQNLFEKIHFESNTISHEKDLVLIHLENAMQDDWQEWMIKDINTSIENISQKTNSVIELNNELKKRLETSKYASIFNFWIYNNWIKTQVREPLQSIENLLEKNILTLKSTLLWINNQISQTPDDRLKWSLLLQEKRLEMQLKEVERYKTVISSYLQRI